MEHRMAHMTQMEIADAIVKAETPDGKAKDFAPGTFGWERLDAIRDRCGEGALIELYDRYGQLKQSSPQVYAPLSQSSSSTRGGATSRTKSKPRKPGASRRASS